MSVTSTTEPPEQEATVSGLWITYALFGGILAWMAHLIAQSGLNGWVCETGQLWPFHAVTVATALMTLHALRVGWRISHPDTSSPQVQAARFLGWMAVVFNVFNLALIAAEWVPVVVVHPCSVG